MKDTRIQGVVALCLLLGNGWLLVEAYPSEMRWPFAACVHFAVIGVVGLIVLAVRRRVTAVSLRQAEGLVGLGICLFVLPAAVLQFAMGKVSPLTSVAVFCAVPMLTVLAAGVLSDDAPKGRGLLVPALVGLGGALLLFPLGNPGSVSGWLFLGMVMASAVVGAIANVWMKQVMEGVEVAAAAAVIGIGSGVGLAVVGITAGWPHLAARVLAAEVLRCVVFDLPVVWLTLWLMKEVSPVRLSSRFLLGPLATFLEGYAADRGRLSFQMVAAVVFLAAGGVMLLVKDEPEELPGLHLR